MSQYKHNTKNKTIIYGYDKQMDYIFIMLFNHKDKMIYSNIDDRTIDFTSQIDFTYFEKILETFNVELPEEEKIKVLKERAEYLDTLETIDYQIKARFNSDLIGEDDRKFGIEIGQILPLTEWSLNIQEYEFFKSEIDALTRVNIINGAFIDSWSDL